MRRSYIISSTAFDKIVVHSTTSQTTSLLCTTDERPPCPIHSPIAHSPNTQEVMTGNMVSRHQWLGSAAFCRNYEVTVSQPYSEVLAYGPEPEWKPEWRHRPPTMVRFVHKRSRLRYRATVNDSELPGAHPDPYLVYQEIFWDWAIPDIEMEGPVLGESLRIDGLQGYDLAKETSDLVERESSDQVALIAAEKKRALTLWGFDGLRTLVKLPLEVRAKIYELTFS